MEVYIKTSEGPLLLLQFLLILFDNPCLFISGWVAINRLTALARPLTEIFSQGLLVCSGKPLEVWHCYCIPVPVFSNLLRATILQLPLGETRRFPGRPRSEGLSDQRIESRVLAEKPQNLILAERPSPQVMACLTSAAAAAHGALEVIRNHREHQVHQHTMLQVSNYH